MGSIEKRIRLPKSTTDDYIFQYRHVENNNPRVLSIQILFKNFVEASSTDLWKDDTNLWEDDTDYVNWESDDALKRFHFEMEVVKGDKNFDVNNWVDYYHSTCLSSTTNTNYLVITSVHNQGFLQPHSVRKFNDLLLFFAKCFDADISDCRAMKKCIQLEYRIDKRFFGVGQAVDEIFKTQSLVKIAEKLCERKFNVDNYHVRQWNSVLYAKVMLHYVDNLTPRRD